MIINSNIPKEVKELLSELNIVQSIPPMSKLNVHDLSYSKSTLSESFNRWYYNESSEKTTIYIDELITRSIEVAKRNRPWSTIIRDEVSKLRPAIDNQINLYSLHGKKQRDTSMLQQQLLRIDPTSFDNSITENDENEHTK